MKHHAFRRTPLAAAVVTALSAHASAALPGNASDAFTLPDDATGQLDYFYGYDVAPLPDGGFEVIWAAQYSSDDQSNPSYGEVWAQHYDSNGEAESDALKLFRYDHSGGTVKLNSPAIAADADGDLVAAWSTTYHGDCTEDVYLRHINADNTLSPDPDEGETDEKGCLTDLAMDADGDFAMVYDTDLNWDEHPDAYAGAYLSTYSANGQAYPKSPLQLGSGTSEPALAIQPDGTLLAGYTSDDVVKGQRYSLDGSKLGDEFLLEDAGNHEANQSQTALALAAGAEGGFVSLWRQQDPNLDANRVEDELAILGQRISADGSTGAALQAGDSNPDDIDASGNNVTLSNPALGADTNGNLAAFWVRQVDAAPDEPKASLYDYDNNVVGEPETLFVDDSEFDADTVFGTPKVAMTDDRVVVIWSQKEDGEPPRLRGRVFDGLPAPEPKSPGGDDSDTGSGDDGNSDDEASSGGGGSTGPVMLLALAAISLWRRLARH